MTQSYNEERNLILQPATRHLASLHKNPCPTKLAQCLPTIYSVLAKAEFPSQEFLCASLLLAR